MYAKKVSGADQRGILIVDPLQPLNVALSRGVMKILSRNYQDQRLCKTIAVKTPYNGLFS